MRTAGKGTRYEDREVRVLGKLIPPQFGRELVRPFPCTFESRIMEPTTEPPTHT
jgi:hypothetical protein